MYGHKSNCGFACQLKTAGKTLVNNVPSDGVYAGYYCQAAIKGSPNPNAGKLWVEWLVSDDGALNYLKGGALPADITIGATAALTAILGHEAMTREKVVNWSDLGVDV